MVTNNYTPYAGGVVRAIQTYVDALYEQGHTVYIITLDFGVVDDPWYVLRVPSCFRCQFRGNIISVPWRMHQYVADCIRQCRPDVVHLHSPFVLGEAGLRAARACGIPVVFTYHSLYERFVSYFPVPQKVVQKFVLRRVHALCRRVDAVIAPSRYIVQRLYHVIPAHMVWYVPTPIRPAFFHNTIRMSSTPSRYIICVGRFQPEKQIDHVIDAYVHIRKHIDVTLVLIGFGASYDYLCWYAHTYHGLPDDAVQFVIRPELPQLISWYHAAGVFVSASPEAQGLVFAEACAAGVPIVAYNTGGASDIVQHGDNGYLVDNAYNMASRVIQIYENASLWRHMVQAALGVSARYHPYRSVFHLIDHYEAVRLPYTNRS